MSAGAECLVSAPPLLAVVGAEGLGQQARLQAELGQAGRLGLGGMA